MISTRSELGRITSPQTMNQCPGRDSGYITDVEYPRHFFRETMPVWLASVCTALGRRAPDLTRPYTWLDLGCGSGLGTVVAAATNPLGRFIGVDVHPESIARARVLAQAAGIANASFHCLSFDQVLETTEALIPACDFIVSQGVYSWLPPLQRQAVQRLAAQRLQPGGILHLAYLSHPGSASFASAQRLMRMVADGQPGGSADKMRAGIDLLRDMAQSGAGYFLDNPHALRSVPKTGPLAKAEVAYFAHDYLNTHRDALHVADVMADFAAVDCEYAGSAAPYENIETASLPAGAVALLQQLRDQGADAAMVETFKDLCRNQSQRTDLYQRDHPAGNLLSPDAQRTALLAQRVCLLPVAAGRPLPIQGILSFESRIGPVKLPMPLVVPLLDALQDSPRSYAELARLPAYADDPGLINTLLQMLAWSGWLQFLRPDATNADAAAWRLNAVLADEPPPFNGPIVAAAAIGSAIPAPGDPSAHEQQRLKWLGASMPHRQEPGLDGRRDLAELNQGGVSAP
ncbi:class I SAM-dependent methyltransferase [Pectobacterium actinidiae]|uniref:class I SAM-dependent methyltransferase n=1 Tax=Pectobacterium actinidiae TaxID=1507808 RepID=UPI0037FB3FBD